MIAKTMPHEVAITKLHDAAHNSDMKVSRVTSLGGSRLTIVLEWGGGEATLQLFLTDILQWEDLPRSSYKYNDRGNKIKSRMVHSGEKPWDDENHVLKLYEELGTIVAVANYFGVSETTIAKRLRRWGVEASKPRVGDKDGVIIDLRKEQRSCREIAKELGISKATVVRAVQRLQSQGRL